MIEKPTACLSVVVPAYNEETTIAGTVKKLLELPHLLEVVIVDDCSSDRTPQIAEALAASDARVRVARHKKNSGKTEGPKNRLRDDARRYRNRAGRRS
jgi:glycosyltransferase involved in cell wall biosynthesis